MLLVQDPSILVKIMLRYQAQVDLASYSTHITWRTNESLEIERATDLRKVLEEQILNSEVELSLREVLGIAMKEFHDSIVHLVKRKRLSIEPEPEKSVNVKAAHIEEVVMGSSQRATT